LCGGIAPWASARESPEEPSIVLRLNTPPPDYTPPVLVYLVEEADAAGGVAQVAGFFSEDEAEALVRTLNSERRAARVNTVPIHRRVVDYEHDR
jgi:hypothetical protein